MLVRNQWKAGNSGRSRMSSDFGVDPGLISAIIAGGQDAVFQAVEECEDDEDLGALTSVPESCQIML